MGEPVCLYVWGFNTKWLGQVGWSFLSSVGDLRPIEVSLCTSRLGCYTLTRQSAVWGEHTPAEWLFPQPSHSFAVWQKQRQNFHWSEKFGMALFSTLISIPQSWLIKLTFDMLRRSEVDAIRTDFRGRTFSVSRFCHIDRTCMASTTLNARGLQLLSEIGYFHASIQVSLPVFWQEAAIRLSGPFFYVRGQTHSTLLTNVPTKKEATEPGTARGNCPRLRELL
jgi:hypothetical protein